jgi:hypothetical protein
MRIPVIFVVSSFASLLVLYSSCAAHRVPGKDPVADMAASFEGTWNYAVPSLQNGSNVAYLNCPIADGGIEPFLTLPQLGSLELKHQGSGVFMGHTDQGCDWRFVLKGDLLELSPVGQSCHNRVFDIDYDMNRWILELSGKEQVNATSHNPQGDCSFELNQGKRVLADDRVPFVGTWVMQKPDAKAKINMAQEYCSGSNGTTEMNTLAPANEIHFERLGQNSLEAVDSNGCRWSFEVRGNTAWLSSIPQRCSQPDGSALTLYYWSFASQEGHGFEILSGTRTSKGKTCGYVVTAAEMVRP